MDAWLGPGIEPVEVERRSILSRLTLCSLTTGNADGALRTRTALVEQVSPSGHSISVRLMGSGLYDDVIPNPRVVVSAVPSIGPYGFVVVNGLARIRSHMTTGGDRELLVLDVTIQRMECWSEEGARISMKQAVRARAPQTAPPVLTESLVLREA